MRRHLAGILVTTTIAATIVALSVAPAGAAVVDRAKVRRPGPPRVVVFGDSITTGYQDRAAELFALKGYQTFKFGYPTTSLLDQGFCGGQLANKIRSFVDPDIVVVEHSGNYNSNAAGIKPCGKLVPYGSATWLKKWENAAKNNQRKFTKRGARFYWMLVPAVIHVQKAPIINKVNAIYRRLGPTIDVWTPFGGPNFDPALHIDVEHLNAAGADLMARTVVNTVG